MPKRGLLKLIVCIVISNSVLCSETNLIIRQIDSYNELTQAWVTSIVQDYIGFMWFGTHDGVYRYDGNELKVYQSIAGNQLTLPGNNVREIYEDSSKNLWVTTSRGVSLYDRNRDCFIYHSTWPGNNFADIAEDESGNTYFGSFTGFFQYLPDSEIFKRYIQYPDSSDLNNGHQEVYVTKNNRIILNGPYGISEFNQESKKFTEVFNEPLPFDGDAITCIIQDYTGAFWFGTRDYGLINYSQLESKAYKRLKLGNNHVLIDGTILSLMQSSDSVLWIGTENHGLVLLDLVEYYAGNLDIYSIKNEKSNLKLSNNSVYSIYEDIQKNIWIGTYSGLNIYSSYFTDFNFFDASVDPEHDIGNDIINTFLENGSEIWIGTENGIRIYNREDKSLVYFNHNPDDNNSLSSNAVWTFKKDIHGNIWVGTWGGGLNKYIPSTHQFINKKHIEGDQNSLSNNNVFSITEDENGIMWIATMGGGLNLYDPVRDIFRNYMHDNLDSLTIPGDWVRQVYIDSKNRFWVLTYNAVSLFDREKETFTNFYSDRSDASSISDDGAIVIFEDSRANIWLGTESGLNLFHPQDSSFTQYLISDGLPSNVIQAILEDDDENLWISTYNGISKFINAVNLPENPEFINFGVSDGLQGNKFNRRSALKTSDNYLIFGGNDGLNSFNPKEIRKSDYVPKLAITKALILNKFEAGPRSKEAYIEQNITLTDEIKIKHKQSVFTLYFTSFDFLIPEKNQYAYKLEGFEEGWNYVGNNRSATYTNLDQGKYVFRVKAANSSGLWMEDEKDLRIVILPPWYRTFWAYSLYFVIILFSILTFRKFVIARTKLQHQLDLKEIEKEKLDQLNKMKTRFFTNISHEFRTPLTLIINPLETLLSDINILPSIKQQLSVVQVNARRLLRLINQLLDISKIETDHLDLKVSEGDVVYFVKEIATLFRWPASQRNIDINFISNKESCIGFFDGDKIEKICYNLISNALKYTPDGGKISIEITIGNKDSKIEDGFIGLSIKDSGVGIRKEEQDKVFEQFYRGTRIKNQNKSGFGIGLAVVNGLVNAYHGTIDIDSKEGKGTEFNILLPLSKKYFKESEIEAIIEVEESITLDVYDLEHEIVVSKNQELESDDLNPDQKDKRATLLIVEDDKDLRSHLKGQFSNYSIMEAGDGEEALIKINEQHPDLIVCDVRMPKMDGFEFCKRIKANENTSHIPFILLTAKATSKDEFEGLSIGADAYITKPFDIKILKTTIENLIESRKQLKEKYSKNFALEPSEISITSVDEKFLHKAVTIVEEHIADPDYSVDMFSKEIGMSRSHLHRKFVGLAGVSPSGFIRTMRMKRAAQLLTKGQLTVSEILYEVGIKSRSYFIKSFKEQYGMSPSDFINEFKQGKANLNIG